MRQIPVQVGNKVQFVVPEAEAKRLSRGANVRVVRSRKDKSIVRLLLVSHAMEDVDPNSRFSGDSRKSTIKEQLFSDSESQTRPGTQRILIQHKDSDVYTPNHVVLTPVESPLAVDPDPRWTAPIPKGVRRDTFSPTTVGETTNSTPNGPKPAGTSLYKCR